MMPFLLPTEHDIKYLWTDLNNKWVVSQYGVDSGSNSQFGLLLVFAVFCFHERVNSLIVV